MENVPIRYLFATRKRIKDVSEYISMPSEKSKAFSETMNTSSLSFASLLAYDRTSNLQTLISTLLIEYNQTKHIHDPNHLLSHPSNSLVPESPYLAFLIR